MPGHGDEPLRPQLLGGHDGERADGPVTDNCHGLAGSGLGRHGAEPAGAQHVGRGPQRRHQILGRQLGGGDQGAVGKRDPQVFGLGTTGTGPLPPLTGGLVAGPADRALAQQSRILFLDEPTTFLDISHQAEVLDLLTDLNRDRGTKIVMVLHDLNLAARDADHVIAMSGGAVRASGEPAAVITTELVSEVFGMDSQAIPDPVLGKLMVLPIGRHHVAAPTVTAVTFDR